MSPRSIRSTSARSALSAACCTLLLVAAAGCGSQADDDSGTATDPSTSETTPTDTSTPSPSPGDESTSSGSGGNFVVGETVEPGQAVIVSASNVKVETTPRATALVNDEAVDAFVAALDRQLAADVRTAVQAAKVPADSTLFGSVVSVGCETPSSVDWISTFDGIEARATLPKPGVQCLVPVTSVALFLVPTTS